MTKEKTIAGNAILPCESEAEIDFLAENTKQFGSAMKITRQRQMASNSFELELYCEDLTDVFFLGTALGKAFPNRNKVIYSGELEEETN